VSTTDGTEVEADCVEFIVASRPNLASLWVGERCTTVRRDRPATGCDTQPDGTAYLAMEYLEGATLR
jgi:hypothetical protein